MVGLRRLGVVAASFGLLTATLSGVGAGAAARAGGVGEPPHLSKLEHIVVLMQENRSYDHYFGALNRRGQSVAEPAVNSRTRSATVAPFHQSATCEVDDLNHSWTGTHAEINQGRMNGFPMQNAVGSDPAGRRSMGYYDSSDLPFYYRLANDFGVGDRYFASVPGPTYPNRFYEMAGTTFGHTKNDPPPTGGFTQPTIFGRLQEAGVSWKVYDAQFPTASFFADVRAHMDHVQPISQYTADAAAGTLPQVAFIEPTYVGKVTQESDEHPPANIQVGQQFTASVVRALMTSPNWSTSAFLLTWDEHGGYYDHVAPPVAPKPDDIAPVLGPTDTRAAFDRYGVRVPFVAISPFSKPHFVSHRVSDHTSILRLIEQRFQLQPLTRRDARANNLLEYFDFANPHFRTPPILPAATIDQPKAAQCLALHPGTIGV
jgi:phospholipase C